jgi:hypothetical protein
MRVLEQTVWRMRAEVKPADTCVLQEGLIATVIVPQTVVVGVCAGLLLLRAGVFDLRGAQHRLRHRADRAPAVYLQPAGRRCMLQSQV